MEAIYCSFTLLAYYAWPRTPSTKVTRKERNPWRQHVHRATRPRSYAIDKVWEAVTSRCLCNGRSDASCKQYGGVSASYKQFSVSASYKQYVSDECTYNTQSRQKHNMLFLLHAACLKLLVFFFILDWNTSTYSFLRARWAGVRISTKTWLNFITKLSQPLQETTVNNFLIELTRSRYISNAAFEVIRFSIN